MKVLQRFLPRDSKGSMVVRATLSSEKRSLMNRLTHLSFAATKAFILSSKTSYLTGRRFKGPPNPTFTRGMNYYFALESSVDDLALCPLVYVHISPNPTCVRGSSVREPDQNKTLLMVRQKLNVTLNISSACRHTRFRRQSLAAVEPFHLPHGFLFRCGSLLLELACPWLVRITHSHVVS